MPVEMRTNLVEMCIRDRYSVFDYNELSIKGIKKNYQDGLYGADQIINDSMIKDILLC